MDARSFARKRYAHSPVTLVLDLNGAVAGYLRIRGHPAYRWLDRRGRPAGPVRYSFALAILSHR